MKTKIFAVLLGLILPLSSLHAAERSVLFVLDASGSMWGQVEGKTKIEIARETMQTAVGGLDENIDVGLMTYGHRRKGDCKDIELVSHVGQPRDSLLKSMKGLNPKGKTPLSDSLTQAVNSLKQVEGAASVVLVSDGLETCGGDPCAVAKAAVESGVELNIHVIGFGVTDAEAKQLQCIADNGNGKYFTAANAQQLSAAFEVITKEEAPAPEKPATGTVRVGSKFKFKMPGLVDGNGKYAEAVKIRHDKHEFDLPAGKYGLKFGGLTKWVDVKAGEVTEVRLGLIKFVAPEPSGTPANLINLYEQASDNYVFVTSTYQSMTAIPAGVYKLTTWITNTVFENIIVKADEITEVKAGVITLRDGFKNVRLRDANSGKSYGSLGNLSGAGPQGSSWQVAPGKYHLKSSYDDKVDMVIELKAGEEVIVP